MLPHCSTVHTVSRFSGGFRVGCLAHYPDPADTAPHTCRVLRDWKSGQGDGQRAAEAPRVVQTPGTVGGKETARLLEMAIMARSSGKAQGDGIRTGPSRTSGRLKEMDSMQSCSPEWVSRMGRPQQPTECNPAGNKGATSIRRGQETTTEQQGEVSSESTWPALGCPTPSPPEALKKE